MKYKVDRWKVTIWELAKALGLAESNLPDKIYIERDSMDPDYYRIRSVKIIDVEVKAHV